MIKILSNAIVIGNLMIVQSLLASAQRIDQDDKISGAVNALPCPHKDFSADIKLHMTRFLRPKQSMVFSEINKEFNQITKDPRFWQQQLENLGDIEFAHDLMRSFSPQVIVEQAIIYHTIFLHALKGNIEEAEALLRRVDSALSTLDFKEILQSFDITQQFFHQRCKSLTDKPENGFIITSRALNLDFLNIFYQNVSSLIDSNQIDKTVNFINKYLQPITFFKENNLKPWKRVQKILRYHRFLYQTLRDQGQAVIIRNMYMQFQNGFLSKKDNESFNTYIAYTFQLLDGHFCLDSTVALQAYTMLKYFRNYFANDDQAIIDKAFDKRKNKDPILGILISCLPSIDAHNYLEAIKILDKGLEIYPSDQDLINYKINQMQLFINQEAEKKGQTPDYGPIADLIRSLAYLGKKYAFNYLLNSLLTGENKFFEKNVAMAQKILDDLVKNNNPWAVLHKIEQVFASCYDELYPKDLEAIKNLIEPHSTNPQVKLLKIFGMLMGTMGYEQDFEEALRIIKEEEIIPYKLNIRPTFDKSPIQKDQEKSGDNL